ncbi:MAG: AAA family ATPase [Phycisphaerae bacterium]
MNSLPVLRIDEIPEQDPAPQWLVEDLWSAQAVGLIGGAPKSAKTWMALDLALSVASHTPCLGRYRVLQPGPVLVYLAEDPADMVRRRVQAMAGQRHLPLAGLELHVITVPRLRLDDAQDRARLFETVRRIRPRLLLLDPLVRMHRMNENDAVEMAELLGGLRELQKRFQAAVAVVHHTRKSGAAPGQAGQALRGSGDIWAWADSSLYLRRCREHLVLTMEHRAAAAPEPVALDLVNGDPGRLHLQVLDRPPTARHDEALKQRILDALADTPIASRTQLRARLQVKNERLGRALERLREQGRLLHAAAGWRLSPP